MGSGALGLVWSHPFTYASIIQLFFLRTVTLSPSLRLFIIICPNEGLPDTLVAEAPIPNTLHISRLKKMDFDRTTDGN